MADPGETGRVLNYKREGVLSTPFPEYPEVIASPGSGDDWVQLLP